MVWQRTLIVRCDKRVSLERKEYPWNDQGHLKYRVRCRVLSTRRDIYVTHSGKLTIELVADFSRGQLDPDCRTVQLLDCFDHVGPHGRHVCMVFEMLGCNLLSVIKRYNYQGIPIHVVKSMARQMCQGLDFLHRVCK